MGDFKVYLTKMSLVYQGSEEEKLCGNLLFSDIDIMMGDKRLNNLAAYTYNSVTCQKLFVMIEKAINPTENPWKTIYKALLLLHTIVLFGSELSIDKAIELCRFVRPLGQYNSALARRGLFSGGGGTDYGAPVRAAAKTVDEILATDATIRTARGEARQGQDSLVPMGDLLDDGSAAATAEHNREFNPSHGVSMNYGQGLTTSVGAGFGLNAVPGIYEGRPERYFDSDSTRKHLLQPKSVMDSQITRDAQAPSLLDLAFDDAGTIMANLPPADYLPALERQRELEAQLLAQQEQLKQLQELQKEQQRLQELQRQQQLQQQQQQHQQFPFSAAPPAQQPYMQGPGMPYNNTGAPLGAPLGAAVGPAAGGAYGMGHQPLHQQSAPSMGAPLMGASGGFPPPPPQQQQQYPPQLQQQQHQFAGMGGPTMGGPMGGLASMQQQQQPPRPMAGAGMGGMAGMGAPAGGAAPYTQQHPPPSQQPQGLNGMNSLGGMNMNMNNNNTSLNGMGGLGGGMGYPAHPQGQQGVMGQGMGQGMSQGMGQGVMGQPYTQQMPSYQSQSQYGGGMPGQGVGLGQPGQSLMGQGQMGQSHGHGYNGMSYQSAGVPSSQMPPHMPPQQGPQGHPSMSYAAPGSGSSGYTPPQQAPPPPVPAQMPNLLSGMSTEAPMMRAPPPVPSTMPTGPPPPVPSFAPPF